MGGCGPHCRCAGESQGKKGGVCGIPAVGVTLDANGKCPCGKPEKYCCHKVVLQKMTTGENPAIYELCKAHGKRHLCG